MKQSLVLFFFSLLILTSCDKEKFVGEGDIVTQELNLTDIERFALQSSINVFVNQGSEQKIVAEGHQNIIDRLKTSVSNGRWNIEMQYGNYQNFQLTLTITVPDIREMIIDGSGDIYVAEMDLQNLRLRIRGSGDIMSSGPLTVTNNFDIGIEGSGDINLDQVTTSNLDVFIDGSGNLNINGTATNADYEIEASGDVKAYGLTSDTASVFSDGSGNIQIMVTDELDATLRASGSVFYRGNPNISSTITGSGNLINAN